MFEIEFKDLNEALKVLPYARVYQSPFDKENEFSLEVKCANGGSYEAFKKLKDLAINEGYLYDNYFEHMDINGDYCFEAKFYVETGKVRTAYRQNSVTKVE